MGDKEEKQIEHEERVNRNNILADIDALLDTRLALLEVLSPSIYKRCLEDGSYFQRDNNTFKEMSNRNFEFFFRRRTTDLLRITKYPTALVNIITGVGEFIYTQPQRFMKTDRVTLYVTLKPYNVNLNEAMFIAKILNIFYPSVDIKLISTKKAYDIAWISDEISMIFMYNGLKWLQTSLVSFDLVKYPLLHVRLHVPFLLERHQTATQEGIDKITKDAEIYSKLIIHLEFMRLHYFSAEKEEIHGRK